MSEILISKELENQLILRYSEYSIFSIHEGVAPQEKEPDDKPDDNQGKYNKDI